MASIIVSQPAIEPVTLTEAKTHLRVESTMTDDDLLIGSLITSARVAAETICRSAFISQQWKLVLDVFPSPNYNVASSAWYGISGGIQAPPITMEKIKGTTGYEIFLPIWPLISVDSIKYIDSVTGVQTTLPSTEYFIDNINVPPRIVPAFNKNWPSTQNQINAIEVLYAVGYGTTAASVPEGIKSWMKIRVGSAYEYREEVTIVEKGKIEPLKFIDGLLDPYRMIKF